MSYDVDRYHDGYLLTLLPPTVEHELEIPRLSRADLEFKLREFGVDFRDIIDATLAADHAFAEGTTDRTREIRRIYRRAEARITAERDVETLRSELRANAFSKTYLMNALYNAGLEEEAMERLIELLEHSENERDTELGLRLLSNWSPEAYERVAVRFIRGVPWDKSHVSAWAMSYAGSLLRQGLARGLFEELATIASKQRR
jgi:hypothetical protein